ncbi:hypothetical protein HOP50_16g77120 [Chloropicon primus]|uniref:F-box domain-containing protein n=1 Tax=Chloropicon primus TaxID=1764295 RepID=A0A5B8MYN4_9CHLO|nr:hypothetical protein A3770_16p76840 [Chloropicon primus]UPR04371.1 hypothetical protein HOP50_16g77120 [Chloropicon primus]|eukprot:QDZ25166.1 hypothetical protein A3770_16p76840 [Chloropicon primus]
MDVRKQNFEGKHARKSLPEQPSMSLKGSYYGVAGELTEAMGLAGLRSCKTALDEGLISLEEYNKAKGTFLEAQQSQIKQEVEASIVLKKKMLEHEEKMLEHEENLLIEGRGLAMDLESLGKEETLPLQIESAEAVETRRKDEVERRKEKERDKAREMQVIQNWCNTERTKQRQGKAIGAMDGLWSPKPQDSNKRKPDSDVRESWDDVRNEILNFYPSPSADISEKRARFMAEKGKQIKQIPSTSEQMGSRPSKEHNEGNGREDDQLEKKKKLPLMSKPSKMTRMEWALSLVGRRIEVLWKVTSGPYRWQYYMGTVVSYSKRMKKHRVRYDDNDVSYVDLNPTKATIYNLLPASEMIGKRLEILFDDPPSYYIATVTAHKGKSTYQVRYDDDQECDEVDLIDMTTKYRILSDPSRPEYDEDEAPTQANGEVEKQENTAEPKKRYFQPGYDLQPKHKDYHASCPRCEIKFSSREDKSNHTKEECDEQMESKKQNLVYNLPKRIWGYILEHLKEDDLFPFAMTCRYFRRMQRFLTQKRKKGKLKLRTNLSRALGCGKQPKTMWTTGYLKWLYRGTGDKSEEAVNKRKFAIINFAAREGHVDLFHWLAKQKGEEKAQPPWGKLTCAHAAWGGHLRVLKVLREHGCPWDEETCSSAAGGGHLEVLQWARKQACPWDYWSCYYAAQTTKLRGQGEVAKWVSLQLQGPQK